MSILDIARSQTEQRAAQVGEIRASNNIIVATGELNRFVGVFPQWDPDQPADADPALLTDIPCALDLREGTLVLTEAHAFSQPQGKPADREAAQARGEALIMMNQMEFSVAILGAKLGFIIDDEFVAHPMYEEAKYAQIAARALELYLKTPFRVPQDVLDTIHDLLEGEGFQGAALREREGRQSARVEGWHLQAQHEPGRNVRDQILQRQQSGLALSRVELIGSRPVADRPVDAQSGEPRPEFDDFLSAQERNLHRVTLALAQGKSLSEAARLSTSLTGVEPGVEGRYFPLRATAAAVAWPKAISPTKMVEESVRFFQPSTDEAAA